MHDLLPNGSVVLLKNSDHRFMIYGRVQMDNESGKLYDYAGCPYPEGVQNTNEVYLFNNDDIRMVFFLGFQDFEELAYRDAIKEALLKKSEE